jgi:hypothetical protein
MSMRPTPLSGRESPSRRIGVILSILFLTSVGTAATLTSARAGAHEQGDAQIITAQSAATAR